MRAECKLWPGKAIIALALPMMFVPAFAQAPADSRPPQESEPAGRQKTLNLSAPKGSVNADSGSITFVGTATVIIRYAGLTILTDPNFLHKGDHVHLGYGLTSERLTDPAITLDKLPPIDLIVLSHMHGDHFDQLVQQKLDRNIPVVTTPDAAKKLEELGFKARHALHTWDSLVVTKGDTSLRINATPGRHGPPVVAGLLPEVMGSMLEFSAADGKSIYRIYISGDTMVYDDISEIPRRYPDIDLALLHLGGTRILGVVKVTMDGKDGVKMLQIIAPHHAIPIHYNDYDVFKSPLSDFEKEVKAAGLQDKITYLKHGDTYQFKPAKR
jgi:L-ascorbate metabolism protein UlaG (beta-lactamase superfamily)